MNQNKLLIHIGTPKTGTTAIQKFLYKNSNLLKKYNWEYANLNAKLREEGIELDNNEEHKNGYAFHPLLELQYGFPVSDSYQMDTSNKVWRILWNNIKKELRNSSVIISEELLSLCDIEHFLREAKKEYDNIEVVIYLRRQDRYLESIYNQYIKSSLYSDKFGVDERWKSYAHYMKLLNRVNVVIDTEKIHVRVYEKSQLAQGDVIADFLEILGIDYSDSWEKVFIENESLVGNYVEIKRIFNTCVDEIEYEQGQYKHMFWKLNHDKYLVNKGSNTCFIPMNQRIKLMEEYEEENIQIAKSFLGRDTGELFYDEEYDISNSLNDKESMYEDILKTMIAMQLNNNKRLQYVMNQKITKLLLDFKGDRELCLFGSGNMTKDILSTYNLNANLIVDNDRSKMGQEIYQIPIRHPKDIKDWSKIFVIISCGAVHEIEEQLEGYGLKKGQDYVLAVDYF